MPIIEAYANPQPALGGQPVDPRATSEPKISAAASAALALEGVPYAGQLDCRFERFEAGRLTVRMPYQPLLRRPGGTICGPALMALADITLYGVVMSMIGRVELAVTTDITIHFLRRPPLEDVIAEGRLLKLGRRLAVGEVTMRCGQDPQPICHVVGTYAILPA
jgi:uncharacterized protein (TIGR00369 family)